MSFMLRFHQQQQKADTESQYQRLNNIIFQKQQQQKTNIIWLKYFQNFYDQSSTYFIIITSKQQQQPFNSKQKHIKMRKIFPYLQLSQKNDKNQKQQTQKTNTQIVFEINQTRYFDTNRIIAATFVDQHVLIALNDPFQLFFVTKDKHNIAYPYKIFLQHSFQLNNVIVSFTFQSNDQEIKKYHMLNLYGYDKLTQTNKLSTINLMTFDMKQTTQSKDYSPKQTINHFQMFHDDRLYVFGGENEKNKKIDELLWSFDLYKGYWFALEMKYKQLNENFNNRLSAVYDSGKIILLKDSHFYLLEIYQCKITKLELQQQKKFKEINSKEKIKGLIVFEKRLYFYTEKSLLKMSYSLQKEKKQTIKQEKKQV